MTNHLSNIKNTHNNNDMYFPLGSGLLYSAVEYTLFNTIMMMSSNGNIYGVTGPLWGESTRSPVDSPHKGQWCRASIFSLICAWTNDWANIRNAGDFRRHCAHYDVIVMTLSRVWIQSPHASPLRANDWAAYLSSLEKGCRELSRVFCNRCLLWFWCAVYLCHGCPVFTHYSDVIMNMMASQITSLTIVYSTVYSGADQRKYQSSASLAFVWGEFTGDWWIPRTHGQ